MLDVAFIGTGKVSGRYLTALDDLDVDVVAVCDAELELAREAAQPRDAAVYTDYVELFSEETFDVLFLLTPPFIRREPAIMAAERGVDLFIEKPAAVDVADARAIADAIETASVVSTSGYAQRYSDLTDKALELLDGRTVGYVDGYSWTGLPGSEWGWKRETCGGYPIHMSTHVYDLARYVVGDVAEVVGYGTHRLEDAVDYEDVGSTTMRHLDGTVSHVSHVVSHSVGRGLRLFGDGVDLHFDIQGNRLTGSVDGDTIEYDGKGYRHCFGRLVHDFVDAVEREDPDALRTPYPDAVETLELTWAVNETLASGEPVTVSNEE